MSKSRSHRFDPTVLREYDIRGVVGRTLSEDDARAVGRAQGTLIREAGGKTACVGYDGRLSSPAMEAAAVAGLTDVGLDVWRIGRGPTPMLYYATHELGAGGGLMVTGSHNPPDHNGFKMMIGKSGLYGEKIQRLGQIAASGAFADGTPGKATDRPVMDAYIDRLVRDFPADAPGAKKMVVAWDAGNGAAGEAMAHVAARLPGRHVLLNEKIDGTFPSHHPDPTVPENLVQLQETIAREKCDLGIGFDGDGDRIGVVDGQGRILWGDQLLSVLSREVLARHPGATIIGDVKASQVLFDEIAKAGGKPLMWKTGHSLIKSKMAELGAPLAGEMSGHIFYGDGYYGFDDALYVAIRLLGIIASSGRSLAQYRDDLPQMVNTPEVRFSCSEERKFAVVEEVRDRLKAAGAEVNDIDGVRVLTDDGWWLLRASNTQDVLVARCEAKDEAGLAKLKQAVTSQLEASKIAAPPF